MKKMRIGILFGGRSGEHEVSLMSARSVLEAIDREKYEVSMIGITKEGRWIVEDDPLMVLEAGDDASGIGAVGASFGTSVQHSFWQLIQGSIEFPLLDVIFSVLHGSFGEDGTVQGLFELGDIAYVGAGVVGSAVGMDKGVFKAVMRGAGLPVLPAVVINRSEYELNPDVVIRSVLQELSFPLFVKPVNLGSSVGITKATDYAALHSSLDEAARWDRRLLVEQAVDAREIEVSVLGNDVPQASVAGEVVPQREFYDYEAKYISGDSKLLIPAPITAVVLEQVQELAVAAYKAVDCAGMARVDFLLDKSSGDLWLNELNTIPGFTDISMYPKLWQASGMEYSELIDRLIELALERKAQRDSMQRSFEVVH